MGSPTMCLHWELQDTQADGLLLLFALFRYNACIHQCFERRTKGAGNMVNGLANNAEIDDSSNCDATVVLLKKGTCGQPGPREGALGGCLAAHLHGHPWGTVAGLVGGCLPQRRPRERSFQTFLPPFGTSSGRHTRWWAAWETSLGKTFAGSDTGDLGQDNKGGKTRGLEVLTLSHFGYLTVKPINNPFWASIFSSAKWG